MRRFLAVVLAAVGLAGGLGAASAQEKYPSRNIKIIVPYGPGGATDIVARVIGEQLRQILGTGIVVENKPGAFGIIAIEDMARSKPDGYTLMIGNVSTNAITPILFPKKFKINFERDVVTVMRLVDIPEFFMATTKDFPPKTVAEFIAYAKAHKGAVRYGTVGVGSYPHFDMALFAKRAGDLELSHIPNKAGASGVINDMIRGDAQAAFLNVASTAGMVKAGQLRPLALVNHARLPEYPDVPTMQEIGFPGVGTLAWQSLLAPAGTPPEILGIIHKAFLQALQAPAVIDNFQRQNFNIVPSASLADAKTWAAGEMANWKKIVDEVKIDIAD